MSKAKQVKKVSRSGGRNKPFDMELFFSALADQTRLRLLNLIGENEVCVCYFVEIMGVSQPKISRHLAYLRRAGLVESKRIAKWVHYSITEPANPDAAHLFAEVRAWLERDEGMTRERTLLVDVCCAPDPPPLLQGAPPPRFATSARQMSA